MENPFKIDYDAELDTSPELDPDAASHYLTIICILRWMIEQGRVDTMTEVLLLSSHVALPREIHGMAHVGQRCNSRLVYDPPYPEIDHSVFKKCYWSEFYRDDKKAIPVNVPEP